MTDPRDETARLLDGVAEQLRQSEAHVRVAAQHFRDREIRAPAPTSGPREAIC